MQEQASGPIKPAMPAGHLEQLDQIDQKYWWHRVRWRIVRWGIRRYAQKGGFAAYFDIGSGGGGMPGLLKDDFSFGEIHLFDQHVPTVEKLAQGPMTQHQVDLEEPDWRGLPCPQLVTCLDVLEHLSNPEKLLRSLRLHAGSDPALLVVTVPALKALWSPWDEAAGHHRRYTRDELAGLLKRSGWQVSFCSYFFNSAVLPVVLQRMAKQDQLRQLQFPKLPGWLNALVEWYFWSEFWITWRLRIPFGTSLVAFAH